MARALAASRTAQFDQAISQTIISDEDLLYHAAYGARFS